MTKTFKTVYLALLVAQSLALFLFEGLIPLPFLAPGAKLGLANLITLIAIYTLPRWQDTLLVILVRITLATMFGGGPTILLYSLTGGLLTMIGYSAATAFDPEVTMGIFNISCIAPAIGFVAVALSLFFIYPLTKQKVEENVAALAQRHNK